jgi:hypothetical protein
MPDRLSRLRALSENMSPEERFHLTSAEYNKLRQFVMALTPAGLPLVQQAFAEPTFSKARGTGANTAIGVALGAFVPAVLDEMQNLLAAIDSHGMHERYGFTPPQTDHAAGAQASSPDPL